VVLQPGAGVLVIDLHGGSEASIKEGPEGEGEERGSERGQTGRLAGWQSGRPAG
jgi:hypothetical protein